MTARPTICLNMIVKNESHVIRESLDCLAPYLDYWVIVDTGSTDGTQEVIRSHAAELGIPGELHERPWQNFGVNRTQALELAQGHSDYIWVMDADDLVVGDIDLSGLTEDLYELRIGQQFMYWRPQILRSGLPWSYRGVVHEYLHCDAPTTSARLEGDYHVESRRLGNRNADPQKYARDRDLLLAELDRNPDDERSVFYLAQSCLDYGDPAAALQWYRRRAEMGGWDQEVYFSLHRVAECLAHLNEPWPVVLDAFLTAWAYRPTRAESLHSIAHHYMVERQWQLGYFFAKQAAEIPLPDDGLFVNAGVYQIGARDTLAVCASWLQKHDEAFEICRRLLERDDLDEGQRGRIASNRDFSVSPLLERAQSYPQDLVRTLVERRGDSDVTVTVTCGAGLDLVERTLNSLLNCCTDITRAGRFLLVDTGLGEADRAVLLERYPFLEVHPAGEVDLGRLSEAVDSRFWLHLEAGWQFFVPRDFLGGLTSVLEAEPEVDQVGINLDDATHPCGSFADPAAVRRAGDGGRYLLTTRRSRGPAMFDLTRFGRLVAALKSATLDDVLVVEKASS